MIDVLQRQNLLVTGAFGMILQESQVASCIFRAKIAAGASEEVY
jgi:hypothetical protein